MNRSTARHTACLLALASFAPAALAQVQITRTTPPESAVDAIFKRYDSKDTPGCSVAVIDDGKVLLKKSYGMADVSLGVPRTSATSHYIPYSEARVFVALAVAMLVRDGKVSWDDPIRKHVPEVPSYASAVTVRQLLHHTSGLADYGVLDPGLESMWTRLSEDEFFRALARWNKLGFAPGTSEIYSNTDYALLQMLVTRVSGGSLHDYLHGKLLGPLGMKDTRIGVDQTLVHAGHALFHTPDGEGFRRAFPYRSDPVGGISVTTSLDDLIRWEAALRDPARGLSAALEQMEAGAPPPDPDAGANARDFAFGVFRSTYKGLPLVAHHGVGGYAYLVQVPDTRLAVATLCNAYGDMQTMGPDVARLYVASAAPEAATPAPVIGPVVEVPASELQRFVGEYRAPTGQYFDIAIAGKGLQITPRGASAMPVALPVGDGRFRADFPDGSTYLLTFQPDGADMVMSALDVAKNMPDGPGMRRSSTPAWATAKTFAAYPGIYIGDDVDSTLHVRVVNGRVLMATRGRAEIAMQPGTKPDHFVRWDIYDPRFERDASGRVVALVLDATRVKGMRYTKK